MVLLLVPGSDTVPAAFGGLGGGWGLGRNVVGQIAAGKAMGHDEVNHVIRRQPLKSSERRSARCQWKFKRSCALRSCNSTNCRSRPRLRSDFQPNKKIVPSRRGLCARNAQGGQIARDVRGFQVVSGKQ